MSAPSQKIALHEDGHVACHIFPFVRPALDGQILLPHNASRSGVRPQQFERRARLVTAIARGRRWLDDVVSGQVTTVAELCTREKCSVRQVNMTISLAFLAPNLVKAAVEGRLPRGISIERLRDPPTEWSRQFEGQRIGLGAD